MCTPEFEPESDIVPIAAPRYDITVDLDTGAVIYMRRDEEGTFSIDDPIVWRVKLSDTKE